MTAPVEIWQLEGIEAVRGPVTEPLPRRTHEGLMIGLLERGVLRARYRRATHELRQGSLILGQPGEAISFGPLGEAPPVRVCLRIAPSMLGELTREVHGGGTATPSVGQLVTPDPLLVGLVRMFLATLTAPASPLVSTSRAHEMLTRIVRVHTTPGGIDRSLRSERALVRRARAYLEENASTNINLNDLAQLVNVSAYYLNRVFSAEVGIPPHAYQTQVRIERGKRLLAQGLPVHRVAVELGFYDQSHFTNQFRRLLGYPPSAYRDRKNLQA